jgi:hypothetical protein
MREKAVKIMFCFAGMNGKAPDEKIYPPTLPDVEEVGKRQEVNNAIEDQQQDRKKEMEEEKEKLRKKEMEEEKEKLRKEEVEKKEEVEEGKKKSFLPQLVDIVDEVFQTVDTDTQPGQEG